MAVRWMSERVCTRDLRPERRGANSGEMRKYCMTGSCACPAGDEAQGGIRGAARKPPGKADLRSRALRRFGRSHGAATASAFAPLLAASTRLVAPAATAAPRGNL